MSEQNNKKPIEVAVIGGGCAAIATAFELTRAEHRGKYHVTLYQLGWRLGGKGACGRGPAERIEEHGLHIWLGFYENAFRLLRECYAELGRDPECRFADWRDAFILDPFVSVADRTRAGRWSNWMACFPPAQGLPGDSLQGQNPFTIGSYMVRTASLLRTLLRAVQTRQTGADEDNAAAGSVRPGLFSTEAVLASIRRILKYELLLTMAGLVEAVGLLELVFAALPNYPENVVVRLLEGIAASARRQFEQLIEGDDELRRLWEIIDLVLAIQIGVVRFSLISDPRGFDAINEYECLEWLKLNGASERSLNSAFIRGLYDLVLAYEDGDFQRPGLAAGQGVRGALRMFFTYRGAFFWKMRAGMGDVVFAPFYEVLKKRAVTFRFFHRLENVKLVDPVELAPGERPYVEALEFDVQAEIKDGAHYEPLIDVRGLPCWPSRPDFEQLVDGDRLQREQRDFESHWDRGKAGAKVLRVVEDFDFVVLGVGGGAVPYVCRELVERDPRWRIMVERVKTVATQAFQIWMREDMAQLGWTDPPSSISAFVQPFDTWADMRQLIPEEGWSVKPRAIAYFCSVLPDPAAPVQQSDADYPQRRRDEVRANAISFLNHDIQHLWPKAVRHPGEFRWDLLIDPEERQTSEQKTGADESHFDSQFWTANVNPSDRYVLALPGSLKYRISPLDNTYDNFTIAGDWTDCGFNEGCVEAAVMSGRLAAHAIARSPSLEDIIGYDHP